MRRYIDADENQYTILNKTGIEKQGVWEDVLTKVSSAQLEQPFEIQEILDYLDTVLYPIISPEHWNVYSELYDMISTLPSVQTEPHYCRECKWSRCHINVDKYGKSETYWWCLNWDGGTDEEGYCYEWERKIDE